jgi:hypothetical protein
VGVTLDWFPGVEKSHPENGRSEALKKDFEFHSDHSRKKRALPLNFLRPVSPADRRGTRASLGCIGRLYADQTREFLEYLLDSFLDVNLWPKLTRARAGLPKKIV